MTWPIPISQALEVNSPYGARVFSSAAISSHLARESRCQKKSGSIKRWLPWFLWKYDFNYQLFFLSWEFDHSHFSKVVPTHDRVQWTTSSVKDSTSVFSPFPYRLLHPSVPAPLHLILKPWVLSSCGRNPCNLGCEGNGDIWHTNTLQ